MRFLLFSDPINKSFVKCFVTKDEVFTFFFDFIPLRLLKVHEFFGLKLLRLQSYNFTDKAWTPFVIGGGMGNGPLSPKGKRTMGWGPFSTTLKSYMCKG